VGEEWSPSMAVKNLLVPLSIRDIQEAIEDQGIPKGTAMALLSLFGMGLQSYSPKIKQSRKRPRVRPYKP